MDDGTSINLSKHTNTTEWIGNSIKIEREQGKITFKKNASASPTKYYTIRIPRGGEYHTVLEDGTKVWLNAESEIRFPAQFNDNERHIFISGEAYFEVAHNPSQPFIAETDLGKIKVFGTTFNIRWYPKEEEIKTTLIEGSIGFKDKTATSYTKINPGYQISYKQGQATVVEKIKINNEIAWKNRQFCFERQQLANIMEEIARWYNANIIFQDNSLKKLRFTGTLNRYSKIETLLHYLEEGCDLRFQIDGQTITIMRK